MAAVGQPPPQPKPNDRSRSSVTQLEFNQAMSDFKTMFPDMDAEVIEIVLRANNGTVDATIDQLLAMSTDNENEKLRAELDATENDELPPSYKPATPPPSYHQAVPFAQSSTVRIGRRSSSQSPSLMHRTSLPVVKRDIPKFSKENSSEGATGKSLSISEVKKKWNPPLLGPLPATFLRLDDYGDRDRRKGSLTLSSAMLQKRMQENERQRRNTISTDDPELAQYLEDERIALFLQNEEFLRELMGNKEFLTTLENDTSGKNTMTLARHSHSHRSHDRSNTEAGTSKTDEHLPLPHSLSNDETDAAFREKLKNMGKVSRRKFAQLASMFSRRKRAFKPILGDGINPSRDNLLSHEDEYSENSDDDNEPDWNKKDSWNSHQGDPCEKSTAKHHREENR